MVIFVVDSFKIRMANASDLPGICVVERRSFQEDVYPSFLLEKLISDPQAMFYVLTDELGGIIGYCVAKVEGSYSHLISLAVLPERRRLGGAIQMLSELFAVTKRFGIREVRLEVRTSNDPAIRLYRRFGFRDEGVLEDYYPDGSAALSMRMVI
jgi:ribosomal-protein-alanine N-acetyltransferase